MGPGTRNDTQQLCAPLPYTALKLKFNSKEINLFGIWAMPYKSSRAKSYVGQIWRAIHYYSNCLDDDSILIGDFNSNAIWDKKRKYRCKPPPEVADGSHGGLGHAQKGKNGLEVGESL